MITALDFSGMYGFYDFSDFGKVRVIDMKDLSGTRLYIDRESEEVIRERTGNIGSTVRLIDTGDHHYMTRLFLYDLKEPFDLLVFDNHNDSQPPAIEGMRSCGSWIRDALSDLPELISSVKLIQGNDRTTMIKGAFSEERPLYISIDKDVLSEDICPTDWDQGDMGLSGLEALLEKESKGRRIAGFDICGGPKTGPDLNTGDIRKNMETDLYLIRLFNRIK